MLKSVYITLQNIITGPKNTTLSRDWKVLLYFASARINWVWFNCSVYFYKLKFSPIYGPDYDSIVVLFGSITRSIVCLIVVVAMTTITTIEQYGFNICIGLSFAQTLMTWCSGVKHRVCNAWPKCHCRSRVLPALTVYSKHGWVTLYPCYNKSYFFRRRICLQYWDKWSCLVYLRNYVLKLTKYFAVIFW